METWNEFLDRLAKIGSLELARQEARDDWGRDIPTTVLFGVMGRKIAEQFGHYSPIERSYIFETIELGLGSGDVALSTYVATGLLESLHAQASGDTSLWNSIEEQLGDASMKYLEDWRRWSEGCG